MKKNVFRFEFHWNLFLRVQLAIGRHWFRQWIGVKQATSHCLNQGGPCTPTHICGTRGWGWVVMGWWDGDFIMKIKRAWIGFMISYRCSRYRESHKTVSGSSYLYNDSPIPGNTFIILEGGACVMTLWLEGAFRTMMRNPPMTGSSPHKRPVGIDVWTSCWTTSPVAGLFETPWCSCQCKLCLFFQMASWRKIVKSITFSMTMVRSQSTFRRTLYGTEIAVAAALLPSNYRIWQTTPW